MRKEMPVRAVAIGGVGMTTFGRFPDKSLKQLGALAIGRALSDATIQREEVEAAFFANAVAGLTTGQECIRGETVLHAMGFGPIALTNVENACASGGNALHLAWMSVASGMYDVVLAVGAEKMILADRERMFSAFVGGIDVDQYDFPEEAGRSRSPFVDRYAALGRSLMEERGLTPRDFAIVGAKAHANAAGNPFAQRQTVRSVDEVLDARVVVPPLTTLMCSPVSDGAAAALIVAAERIDGRAVQIVGSAIRMLPATPAGSGECHTASARVAYEAAGVGPDELDFAELHDATVAGEISNWANTGLCPPGDELKWIREGWTERTGSMPVNPSGGLVGRGHPVGATGLAQAHDVVQQLRGTARRCQVPNTPRLALSQCGGGLIDGSTAVSAAHIYRI
jgi:acetyl-CoA acetyltransferase